MDKMYELIKTLKDLKLTRNEIRRGLNEFELSVISKRCKITEIEVRRLVKQFLKRNIRLRRNKNEIWSIRNGKRKQQKGFEGKGSEEIKKQNQKIV